MGKPYQFGFSLVLKTAAAQQRAKSLAHKESSRFEIRDEGNGPTLYYLPHGKYGSQEQWDNGMKISEWVELGQGNEPG